MSRLNQERLRELLDYDPETGQFTWRVGRGSAAAAGAVAGTLEKSGYIRIGIDRKFYRAHRLAFLYMTGSFPVDLVDHKDGDRSNNRWVNLRQATHSQNKHNTPVGPKNKSGYKGVCWFSPARLWVAQIKNQGAHYLIGYFKCPREAAHAYNKAAIELHGEFAVLNPIGDK